MSFDSCKLCGKFASEQYKAMAECCKREGCPGVKTRDAFRAFATPMTLPPAAGHIDVTAQTVDLTRHVWDDDACCIKCGFDGAEWAHWKRNTHEGKASDAKQPLCTGSFT